MKKTTQNLINYIKDNILEVNDSDIEVWKNVISSVEFTYEHKLEQMNTRELLLHYIQLNGGFQ